MTDVVVVTGTTSGLGRTVASRLIDDGFAVVGIGRREMDAPMGPGYTHVRADLSDLGAIPALVKQVLGDHDPVYALVNNAAVGLDGLLPTMHNSEISRVVELDLVAPMLLAKYFCRPMLSRRRGRIVNVSSIVARTGFRGLSVYGAAKAGLEGFSRSLARDLGPRGVTVNCVAPGFLETEMTGGLGGGTVERVKGRSPLGRLATLAEVAAAVSYLVGPDADGVTGTVLTVDGGSVA